MWAIIVVEALVTLAVVCVLYWIYGRKTLTKGAKWYASRSPFAVSRVDHTARTFRPRWCVIAVAYLLANRVSATDAEFSHRVPSSGGGKSFPTCILRLHVAFVVCVRSRAVFVALLRTAFRILLLSRFSLSVSLFADSTPSFALTLAHKQVCACRHHPRMVPFVCRGLASGQ